MPVLRLDDEAAARLGLDTVVAPGAAADPGLVWSSTGAHRTYAPGAPGTYAYAPSAVTEGGRTYYFSCHNDVGGVIADSVWFAQAVKGKVRRQQSVLDPSPGGWDDHHVCDPSVVAGNFGYAGARRDGDDRRRRWTPPAARCCSSTPTAPRGRCPTGATWTSATPRTGSSARSRLRR